MPSKQRSGRTPKKNQKKDHLPQYCWYRPDISSDIGPVSALAISFPSWMVLPSYDNIINY